MTAPPPVPPPAAQADPGNALPVTYATGPWMAFVLDDLAVLLDVPADSRLLAQCWGAAASGRGLDGVLAVIAQQVANYAAVARTDEGTRVVVAGSGRAEVGGSAFAADGGQRRDEQVAGRPPVRLGADVAPDRVVLPLARGIAPAGAIGVGTTAAALSAASAAPAAPPTPPTPPAADPVPVPRVSSDTMPPDSVYDSGIIESLPWRGTDEGPAAPPEPPPPPPPVEPEPEPAPQWGDPFAAPSGGTGAGSIESNPYNPWGPPAQPAWPQPNPPAVDPSPVPVPGTAPGGAPGGPGTAPPPASNPWAPPGATGADQLNPAPAAADESNGPIVHAFACPRGHLNPPYAGTCRICDEPIAAQEGFAAPRPSLGVLKLSTGDTVPLDRDVVLGRAPFHADESAASRPHLVQLASPGNDISRSHVRVNLENWFVQVTDLGSTNGTVVTLPDQAPVRLRPHDPFTILPGTTVNIADEITLRYEVS